MASGALVGHLFAGRVVAWGAASIVAMEGRLFPRLHLESFFVRLWWSSGREGVLAGACVW